MALPRGILVETEPAELRLGTHRPLDSEWIPAAGADRFTSGLTGAETEELLAAPEWALACRVAASPGLCKSELLPRFLLYVCQESLLGRAHEISEQRIGVRVFNRAPSYNPGEDNIVRSYARLLRNRLDAYFSGEGSDEPIRIAIHRGGYIPSFHANTGPIELRSAKTGFVSTPPIVDREGQGESVQPATDSDLQVIDSPEKNRRPANADTRFSARHVALAAMAGLLCGVLIMLAVWLGTSAIETRQQSPAHALWLQMFSADSNTLIVPADSGLGILENLTGRLANVEDYVNGSYLSGLQALPGLDAGNLNDLRRQRYTSVVDLDIAARLTQLPEFVRSRTQIQYARNISPENLKNANLILLGSKHTNPWVSLFESRLNFKLDYNPAVDDSYVLNNHPVGSEQKIYRNETNTARSSTYGSIAYLPGLDGSGHVLIIQGLNMAGTQAAADALFNPRVIGPVLEKATLPNGALRPFELLVQTASVGATAPEVQVIATRVYPQ